MEKLSDIAKDYLADFEVLTEARKEIEQQLANWWAEIFTKTVKPALLKEHEAEPNIWENQNRPGMCHWRVRSGHPVYLELLDPRASDRRFYTVSVMIGSQPDLKKLSKQAALITQMNKVARIQKVAWDAGLNWDNRQLASLDVEILADDPEETARQVCDAAVRYYRVVLEFARASAEEK